MKEDYPPTFYKALHRLEGFNWKLADSITDEAWELIHEHFSRLLHIAIDDFKRHHLDLRDWTPNFSDRAYDALSYSTLVDYPTEVVKQLGYRGTAPGDGEWSRVWDLADKIFQKKKLSTVLGEIPREAWTTEKEAWYFTHGFVQDYLTFGASWWECSRQADRRIASFGLSKNGSSLLLDQGLQTSTISYLAYKTVEEYLLPNPWEPIITVWEAGYLTLPSQPYSKQFDELKLILACKEEWQEVAAFLPRT